MRKNTSLSLNFKVAKRFELELLDQTINVTKEEVLKDQRILGV